MHQAGTRAVALVVAIIMSIALGACASGSAESAGVDTSTTSPAATSAAAPTQEETETPPATPDPQPTGEPTEEPIEEPEPTPEPTEDSVFKAGETVTVTSDDEPWATIKVDRVKVVKKYEGGYVDDKPERKGNVFIQARVTYVAIADGVDYNPFDWEIFVGDEAVDNWTTVLNGPEPDLSSGTLPAGRRASGYVVYEVPAKGRVVMSYGNNSFTDDGPVFEVVIRSK